MTYTILAIDDEKPNLLMLEEFLSDETDCVFIGVESAQEGLDLLDSGQEVHAILLDRMMPGMDGMQFLEKTKADERFKYTPVIMQTAAAAQEQVAEGIAAGVFYYLPKPFQKQVLLSILRSALRDYDQYCTLRDALGQTSAALRLVDHCQFSVQTLEDVKAVSAHLAGLYDQPDDVLMGLSELMINAVEHGNLGITYDEKTELNHNGEWEEEVARRLALSENKQKYAKVMLERTSQAIVLTIEDCGDGFDWDAYLEISPERALHNHGRGIAMSRMLSFDEIEYVAPGNKVICTKHLQ